MVMFLGGLLIGCRTEGFWREITGLDGCVDRGKHGIRKVFLRRLRVVIIVGLPLLREVGIRFLSRLVLFMRSRLRMVVGLAMCL